MSSPKTGKTPFYQSTRPHQATADYLLADLITHDPEHPSLLGGTHDGSLLTKGGWLQISAWSVLRGWSICGEDPFYPYTCPHQAAPGSRLNTLVM